VLFIPESCSFYTLDIDKAKSTYPVPGLESGTAAFFLTQQEQSFSIKTATDVYLTNWYSYRVQILHMTDLFQYFIQHLSFSPFLLFLPFVFVTDGVRGESV
jgi:hypothetical protein